MDAPVGGAQAGAGPDAGLVEFDARRLQSEALDIGMAAGGDQQMRAVDRLLQQMPGQKQPDAGPARLDADDLDVFAQNHAFARQPCQGGVGQFRVFARQHRPGVQHRDLAAEAAEGLRQFDTRRAAAEDHQTRRQARDIENALVGQRPHQFDAGDGGQGGGGAGGDDEAARLDDAVARLAGVARDEFGSGADHPHPHRGEARGGIIGRDGGDHLLHVPLRQNEIDARLPCRNAEQARLPHGMGGMARRDQRLGRHAAVIEAVAAHRAFLHQHGGDAERGSGGGRRQSAGACADDAEIGSEKLGHQASSRIAALSRLCVRRRLSATGARASKARPPSASSISRVSRLAMEKCIRQCAAPEATQAA